MLIDMGIDIMEISRRLGHESVKTTIDTYGQLYPDKDLKIADRIDKIKRGAPTDIDSNITDQSEDGQ